MLKFHEHIDNPTKGQIAAEFLKGNYLALIDEKLYNEDNFVHIEEIVPNSDDES
jgi:hypothetical protein